MDRLRHLTALGAVIIFPLLAAGCQEQKKPEGPAPSRFAAVKGQKAEAAAGSFCEKAFPAEGPSSRRYVNPSFKELEGVTGPMVKRAPTWTWVNLWATWCAPCMAEMGLLGKWENALREDGVPIHLEMISVDADQEAFTASVKKGGHPGVVRWMPTPEDLGTFMKSVGLAEATPIPVHVLVDARGMVRCVRVGAVHEGDYGAVKAMLMGG